MERLSLQDPPAPGPSGANAHGNPQGASQGQSMPPQLPAQMFTTAAQLLDLTDKKLMVSLRDGRKFIGVLRSWDQYANLVLQDTVERIFVQQYYADIPRGIFLVRGENVLLLGEIVRESPKPWPRPPFANMESNVEQQDLDKDDYIPEPFREASAEKVTSLQKKEREERARRDKLKQSKLQAMGFEGENIGEILL